MKVGEYRTVVNVIVVADVRGAAESVYLGATRSDEFFFLNRCGSSYQDSLPLAKLGLSTLSLLGSSGSNGISLPLLTEAVESFSALVSFSLYRYPIINTMLFANSILLLRGYQNRSLALKLE